jgi:hypothetical protein
VKRIGLNVVMALSAINIWTGSPLLALWVGSRLFVSNRLTMGAVFAVAVVMFATSIALIYVLSIASEANDRLLGRQQTVRRHVPWLRSARGERVEFERERIGLTTLERLMVVMVVAAFVAFELWFFIASPSPIEPGPAKH